jgi:23S rRNA pseudouridine1911/1915/1917 synthase
MIEPSPAGQPASQKAELVVDRESSGQRLDRFLASKIPDLSRSRIQSLIESGHIRVDGRIQKPSYQVETGETIVVEIEPRPPAGVAAEDLPLEVLYEDSDVAVINKPAGMIVHPGAGAVRGTLVAALLYRFGGTAGLSSIGGPMRPGIVHRLDKGTSGAMMIARNDEAHGKLAAEFQNRSVTKKYIALLHGLVKGEAGRIELPIARDLRRRSRMTARRREGRHAQTDWRLLGRIGAFSLIEADLRTGRTHQIRVHFSALGLPVAGDTVYGAPRQERVGAVLLPPLERNFLHAALLSFEHPRTRARIEVRAPLPRELRAYLEILAERSSSKPGLIDAMLQEFL